MKLSELTEKGRTLMIRYLDRGMENWNRSAIWWKPENKSGVGVENMRRWYKCFLDFRQEVLHDVPLEEAYRSWHKAHHQVDECPEDVMSLKCDKINVPQYSFLEYYYGVKRLLDEHIEDASDRKEAPDINEIED